MSNKELQNLITNPKIYYIYRIDLGICNIETNLIRYIIVSDNDIDTEDMANIYGYEHMYYTLNDFFELYTKCSIYSFICSNIDKKFVIKEYVKISPIIDKIKLRQCAENLVTHTGTDKSYEIRDLDYMLQVLLDKKITSFSSPKKLIEQSKGQDYDLYKDPNYIKICNLTDKV